LLLQQCEKWGSYHFDEHNGWQHIKDPDARLSLCVDSLLKLPIEMFENALQHVRGATIILDESVSVIKHLLLSRTLLGKRVEVLERLEIICKLADRVVLMDGNQSDIVVDYIAQISRKPSVKIQNTFTGNTPPIFFVEAGKKQKNG
jgi:HD superfamily phosphodiesterase